MVLVMSRPCLCWCRLGGLTLIYSDRYIIPSGIGQEEIIRAQRSQTK